MDINRSTKPRNSRIVRWRSKYSGLFICIALSLLVFYSSRRLLQAPKQSVLTVLASIEGQPLNELRSALHLALSSPAKGDSPSDSTG